ncbi:NAD(P)-dependent alcohol dehydrogenase [Phenylobacterium kunshanense]|uniref:NAD(P)-dependent alcohol dehydrogenase n=1 Tax=Phenylobacterium kunshanense TaxID=1445034 RepID=A0A328B8X3_9CAUL|nr:NAD(P)-dependent alcohol dehydrogenase [Phenylobacterium kunshanense]RAK63603.1 NAD(P)-dependent alcohol dehydrogenase [Phenylobacterium kunshanense]
MDVTAAITRAAGAPFEFATVRLDDPRPDEVRVRIAAVGVCHTDLVARDGAMPIALPAVFGHEGAGVVDAVGADVTKVKPGDRVAITFRSCGACDRCASGDPAYCYMMPALNYIGMRPDGSKALHEGEADVSSNFFGQSSFASYALAYERNLVRLPDDIPFELAAPLGCGIQTGAGGVMLALAAPAGSSILITGGGAVGLSAVMGAAIQGCSTIIVLEPHAGRRDLAKALGATHVLDPAAGDLSAAVRTVLPHGVDYAFDTTGRPDVLGAIMGCLAPKGVLGVVGIPPPGTPLPGDMGSVLTFGQTVRGIIEGDSDPDEFLPRLIDEWRAGRLPLEKLVKTWPFAEINAAIEAQHHGDCVKVVLTL